MKTEPLLTTASLGALAAAVIAVLVAFGLPITDQQQVAVLGLVAVVSPFALAIVARQFVTPTSQVLEQTNGAGAVVTGPANEIGAGVYVRPVGELPAGDDQAEPEFTPDAEDYDLPPQD